jgi:toxin FitB
MYLLDTNVVSELRKAKPHGAVLAWAQSLDDVQMHLSAMSLGEIQAGIELTREQNPSKAKDIEAWLEQVGAAYNILPLDQAVCRQWARLMHKKSAALIEDAMIAATAYVHGLTVATRNTTDFRTLGIKTYNPFTFRAAPLA